MYMGRVGCDVTTMAVRTAHVSTARLIRQTESSRCASTARVEPRQQSDSHRVSLHSNCCHLFGLCSRVPSYTLGMSLQISTGVGSLVALGLGMGDAATIYALGKRVGNWMMASSGDDDLLGLLDQDEMDVLQRRGIMDTVHFNKTWGKAMRILINGEPQTLYGENAENALEPFSRFTASMVCITTALDSFATHKVVQQILKRLLKELLRTTGDGEDIVASQISTRVNSWRSAGVVRGLSSTSREIRGRLVEKGLLLGGFIPAAEVIDTVDFLMWLLAGSSEDYATCSSDIAGIATVLSELGFAALGVLGLEMMNTEAPCTLRYTPLSFLHPRNRNTMKNGLERLRREQSCNVSLLRPEECFTSFPIDRETADRCCAAWKAGSAASQFVKLELAILSNPNGTGDLLYTVTGKGRSSPVMGKAWSSPNQRSGMKNANYYVERNPLKDLVEAHGLLNNDELYSAASRHLDRQSSQWLLKQTTGTTDSGEDYIFDNQMTDLSKINSFTVFQAFFMGYYYSVFLGLVDTTSLEVQSVDGAWGFRSARLLTDMRALIARLRGEEDRAREQNELGKSSFRKYPYIQRHAGLSRQTVLKILSSLLLSSPESNATERNIWKPATWCLGVVNRRALLARSLVHPCNTPSDVSCFVLLDVDVGGVPTDLHGLVRPGVAEELQIEPCTTLSGKPLEPNGPDVDFTRHIEADWDRDPETVLLCIRYKGRRVATINPAIADNRFCSAFVNPVAEPKAKTVENAVEYGFQDMLEERPISCSSDPSVRAIVQARGRPCMRYTIVGLYKDKGIKLASNCVHTALQASREADSTYKVVVA